MHDSSAEAVRVVDLSGLDDDETNTTSIPVNKETVRQEIYCIDESMEEERNHRCNGRR